MIKLSVMYPADSGARFDLDYYNDTHMPFVLGLLGAACKGASVEVGVCGAAPDAPPTYQAIGVLLFDSPAEFQATFGPAAERILADLPNFTDIVPVVQISDVRVAR